MSTVNLLLVVLVLGVAFANGANDVSKGIATLVGSGTADWRRAVIWGSFWTLLGGILPTLITSGLLITFSGKGVLAGGQVDEVFSLSVAIGTVGWVALTTRLGLPVSTTHAILGSLCGAGIALHGVHGVLWGAVSHKALLPLALSPVLSIFLVAAAAPVLRPFLRAAGRYCVCVERQAGLVTADPAHGMAVAPPALPTIVVAPGCGPQVVSRWEAVDTLHWMSSALTSFCRGVNDSPKIAALAIAAGAAEGLSITAVIVAVAGAMAMGSLLGGLRVTRTLAEHITRLSPENGFIANLVTSLLVALASAFSLPVSTTQVSSMAIAGVGLTSHDIHWRTVRDILLAWIVTIPSTLALSLAVSTAVRSLMA